jgi:DNA-binding GntR family transcriptional regulator
MQAESFTSKTLGERAYEIIKGYILKNTVLPGDDLSIGYLADRLEISPTPVERPLACFAATG